MKKLFLTLALCIVCGAVFAQENTIFPKEGKVMEYSTDVKSPMGNQKMDVKQFINSKDGDKITVTTEAAGKKMDITYTVTGDKVVVAFKEAMASSLGQLGGNFEITESNGDLTYPLTFEPNKEYGGASMKVKANVQGMDMVLNISMDNRRSEGKESVTVPAGTYDCIKVLEESVISVMGQDQISELTSWYAPGVGLIKQVTSAMNGMVTTTMELVKISDK